MFCNMHADDMCTDACMNECIVCTIAVVVLGRELKFLSHVANFQTDCIILVLNYRISLIIINLGAMEMVST